jgi:hypothetical protein
MNKGATAQRHSGTMAERRNERLSEGEMGRGGDWKLLTSPDLSCRAAPYL